MPKRRNHKLNPESEPHGYVHERKIVYTPHKYLILNTLYMDELWIKSPKPEIRNEIIELYQDRLIPKPIWTQRIWYQM